MQMKKWIKKWEHLRFLLLREADTPPISRDIETAREEDSRAVEAQYIVLVLRLDAGLPDLARDTWS